MFIQISSGQGPSECQRVVWHVYQKLKQDFTELALVDSEPGREKNCFRSMTIEVSNTEKLDALRMKWEGTVSWRGKSPFRPHHKRQNWFVKIAFFKKLKASDFDSSQVKIEAFRSGGPGGQHVNKTSTAVRAVYLPTGDAVVCSDERSQYMNKQLAVSRLRERIHQRGLQSMKAAESENRLQHYRLERGDAVISFSGKL